MTLVKFNNTKGFFVKYSESVFTAQYLVLNSFLSQIAEHYKTRLDPTQDGSFNQETNIDESAEYKKNTYYNIKRIHDELISTNLKREKYDKTNNAITDITKLPIDEVVKNNNLFYNSRIAGELCNPKLDDDLIKTTGYDLYQIFQVVDRGNNNIGNKVVADLSYFNSALGSDFIGGENDVILNKISERSVFTILSELARDNGFILQQIPNYLNINGSISGEQNTDSVVNEIVDQMFGVHATTKLFGEDINTETGNKFGGIVGFPGYIFQLGVSGSKLNEANKDVENNYGDSFCLDLRTDVNGEIDSLISKNAPAEIKNSSLASCFTVDFGKQNQQMFTGIQLDTAQFSQTEFSLKAWTELINKSATSNKPPSNIFPIMERYMYTCEVSGLGNATIQPLNYFYLKNTPLFSGTYWITNVKHSIQPNNMLTTFKGVRQPVVSKNDMRLTMIESFKKIADRLKESGSDYNKVTTIEFEDTSGLIRKNLNSELVYGEVLQPINVAPATFQSYDGQTIVGCYIQSVTGADNAAANFGMIAYLYNIAKYYTNDKTHKNIIGNMVNAAIADMKIKAGYGDERYSDGNGDNISLSVLVKNSDYSLSGVLHNLLTLISTDEQRYKQLIIIEQNTPIYQIQALNKDNNGSLIDSNLHNVELVSTNVIGTTNTIRGTIQNANMHLDPNVVLKSLGNYHKIGEIGYNTNLYDIFNAYDTDKKTIRNFQTTKINPSKITKKTLRYYIQSITVRQVEGSLVGAKARRTLELYANFTIKSNIKVDDKTRSSTITVNGKPYVYGYTNSDTQNSWKTVYSDENRDVEGVTVYKGEPIFNYAETSYDHKITLSKSISYLLTGINEQQTFYKKSLAANDLMKYTSFIDGNVIAIHIFDFDEGISGDDKSGLLAFKFNKDELQYEISSKSENGTIISVVVGSFETEIMSQPTKDSVGNIKYLGAYDDNKIAFFSMDSVNKNLTESDFIYLNNATSDEIAAISPKTPTMTPNGWINPLRTIYVTSSEGLRDLGNGDGPRPHKGVDLRAKSCSDDVYAVLEGRVIINKNEGPKTGFGRYLVLTHPKYNLSTLYGHLCEAKLNVMPDIGTKVVAGDLIGISGGGAGEAGAGSSKAQHLHFEVREGVANNWSEYSLLPVLDPEDYIIISDKTKPSYPKLTKAEKMSNQVLVKDMLMALIVNNVKLTKNAVAGIMGNIEHESGFNPATLVPDSKGTTSYGLFQFNSRWHTFSDIGNTVSSQIKYASEMSTFKQWAKLINENTSADEAAYLFADVFENCDGCNSRETYYKNEKLIIRSTSANSFSAMFDQKNSHLYT